MIKINVSDHDFGEHCIYFIVGKCKEKGKNKFVQGVLEGTVLRLHTLHCH